MIPCPRQDIHDCPHLHASCCQVYKLSPSTPTEHVRPQEFVVFGTESDRFGHLSRTMVCSFPIELYAVDDFSPCENSLLSKRLTCFRD